MILVALCVFVKISLTGREKPQADHVLINEVCSNNFSVIYDEDRNYCDYVELYNPTDRDTDYDMYLSDNRDKLKKYKIEESIPAKGYLLIWLAGRGNDGYLHAGFGLSKEGEELFLTDENEKTIDLVSVPALDYDETWSRVDGVRKGFAVATATPGESNESATIIDNNYVSSPSLSLEDGFYEVGTTLKIGSGLFQKVYYTLDGSIPDENSMEYTGPIVLQDASDNDNYYSEHKIYPTYVAPPYKVDKANVVRAIAVDRLSGRKSRVVTGTYFCGFEDKEIYDDVEIISLIFDPDDLFNYDDGIFALGKMYDEYKRLGGFMDLPEDEVPSDFTDEEGNEYYRCDFMNAYLVGREAEKEVIMQVFDRNKELSFTQNIGARVAGESSRYNFQKSFNLYARDEYEGDGTFTHGFFKDTDKKVRLRRSDNRIIFQEPMLHKVLGELGLLYQESQMKVVFINGEYWGVYNLRDQYDECYFADKLGLRENEFWLIKNNAAEFGGQDALDSYSYLVDFITYSDASDEEVYDAICQIVDIDNLIDYFCALIYFDDEDIEPKHNQFLWRTIDASGEGVMDGRWRWLVYDLDVTLGDASNNTFEYFRDGGDGLYLPGYLYANEEFRNKFRSRMTELIETTFSYEHMSEVISELDKEYRQQNIASVNRFEAGGYNEEEYEEDLNELYEFFRLRPEYMKTYLEQDISNN